MQMHCLVNLAIASIESSPGGQQHPIGPLYTQLGLEPEPGCGRYLPNQSRLSCLMPANLSPEYKAAEAALRKAREPRERLDCLREMLRTIPKHKGTDHLQADIKSRIKELSEEVEAPKKGPAGGVDGASGGVACCGAANGGSGGDIAHGVVQDFLGDAALFQRARSTRTSSGSRTIDVQQRLAGDVGVV